MKIGDLVIRKMGKDWSLSDKVAKDQRKRLGFGVILSTWEDSSHNVEDLDRDLCLTVYYPKVNKIYNVSAIRMEVIK